MFILSYLLWGLIQYGRYGRLGTGRSGLPLCLVIVSSCVTTDWKYSRNFGKVKGRSFLQNWTQNSWKSFPTHPVRSSRLPSRCATVGDDCLGSEWASLASFNDIFQPLNWAKIEGHDCLMLRLRRPALEAPALIILMPSPHAKGLARQPVTYGRPALSHHDLL